MINGFKEYFISHNEVVYDNHSPGNKQGGISTLQDKSCGCLQKGGSAPIMDVIGYGEPVVTKGLNLSLIHISSAMLARSLLLPG